MPAAMSLRTSTGASTSRPAQPSRPARSSLRTVAMAADNCRDKVAVRKEVTSKGKVFKVTLLAGGGDARVVECPDDMYILDAAEKAGIDLPATCRGGICGACVARVASGTIDASDIDDLSFTVNEEEQAAGMALLCMTRATSDLSIETQCDWGYSLGVAEWKGATGKFAAAPEPLMGKKWNE